MVAESIDDQLFYVTTKDNNDINENNTIEDMEMKELLEKFEALENRVAELEEQKKH